VLIVEDDVRIRSGLAEYLRVTGYLIVEAANAGDAIALFAVAVPIDLVFSDIRMPGPMDGLGLARWIRRQHPGVRVALTSGNDNAARAAEVAEIFVPKPYQAAEVAARIGQLLADVTHR
jgi:CheY-like chemotaxis protein